MRPRIVRSVTCLSVIALFGCLFPTDDQAGRMAPPILVSPGAPVDTAFALSADTYLESGNPNQNFGTAAFVRVRSSGKNRSLLRVDSAALRGAIGGASVVAARLALTITTNGDNWGQTGRAIELHRLTKAWNETAATWNCAADSLLGNTRPDCTGATAWEMDAVGPNPWVTAVTSSATITNGLRGTVNLDVTADVAAFLAGSAPNFGWILKRADEGPSGSIEFGSRESASPPKLVLTISAQVDTGRPPIPPTFTFPADTSRFAVSSSDTAVRYYRTILGIRFDDTTSGSRVRQVLQKYSAQIIGGLPRSGEYIVRIPDPGPTFRSLDSLISVISHEPGVEYSAGLTFHSTIRQDGRYPSDGAQVSKTAWVNAATNGTRAWRAVRAPLAWGCETGTYSTLVTRVAVLDFVFDASHADLAGSSIHLVQPRDSDMSAGPGFVQSHGTQVAGIITARGDNGTGIAGMLWRSDLHLYAMAKNVVQVKDPTTYFSETVIPDIEDAGVGIFESSTDFASDSAQQRRVDRALRHYLDAGAGGLFIKSAGNESDRQTAQAILQVSGGALALTRAGIRASLNGDGSRVIFVVGTDQDNVFWPPSNLISGLDRVAAPATNILSLAFGGGEVAGSGTSFAAPFVAGVAGQLREFDSTLTTGQIKDYLLRGAKEPRLTSQGLSVARDSVNSVPENNVIYQLDAYGSLTLLSRERTGTPTCGYPVRFSGDSIVFQRPRSDSALEIPAGGDIFGLSIAQGGRLMATVGGIANLKLDYQGHSLGEIPGPIELRYLERDTLAMDFDAGINPLFTITGPDARTLDLMSLVPDSGSLSFGEVSPDAQHAALVDIANFSDGSFARRWYVVSLTGGAAHRIGDCSGGCDGYPTAIAWSHDSRHAYFVTQRFTPTTFIATDITDAAGDGSTSVISSLPDVYLTAPRLTGDDVVIDAAQFNNNLDCQRVRLLASHPTTVVSAVTVSDVDACGFFTRIANTPRRFAARSMPLPPQLLRSPKLHARRATPGN